MNQKEEKNIKKNSPKKEEEFEKLKSPMEDMSKSNNPSNTNLIKSFQIKTAAEKKSIIKTVSKIVITKIKNTSKTEAVDQKNQTSIIANQHLSQPLVQAASVFGISVNNSNSFNEKIQEEKLLNYNNNDSIKRLKSVNKMKQLTIKMFDIKNLPENIKCTQNKNIQEEIDANKNLKVEVENTVSAIVTQIVQENDISMKKSPKKSIDKPKQIENNVALKDMIIIDDTLSVDDDALDLADKMKPSILVSNKKDIKKSIDEIKKSTTKKESEELNKEISKKKEKKNFLNENLDNKRVTRSEWKTITNQTSEPKKVEENSKKQKESKAASIKNEEEKVYNSKEKKRLKKRKIIKKNDKKNNSNKSIESSFDPIEMFPRRSKRAKIDHSLIPIYDFEEVKDYSGGTTIVSRMIGCKKRFDQVAYMHESIIKKLANRSNIANVSSISENESNESKEKTSKSKLLQRKNSNSQLDIKILEEKKLDNNQKVENYLNKYIPDTFPVKNDERHDSADANKNLNDKNQSDDNEKEAIKISSGKKKKKYNNNKKNCSNDSFNEDVDSIISQASNINQSQEIVYIDDEKTNEIQNFHLFCYSKNSENKNYEVASDGVGISVLSNTDGVLSIDPKKTTTTQQHETKVLYVVQKGTCIFSLNGILSKHTQSDIIKIPESINYKIKNVSSDSKVFLYFQFQFS